MTEFSQLWPGGPFFAQEACTFPIGTDSVLLADFAHCTGVKRAFDLGCGAGILSLLLLHRIPGLSLGGIDIQPKASECCQKNLLKNGWDASGIVTGDLRNHRSLFKAGFYDLVICNPPYYTPGSGRVPSDPARADARSETACTIMDICTTASYLCKNGGNFALVHKPERLAEVLRTLSDTGLEPKRLRFVSHKAGCAPNLVLIEGRKNAKIGLVIEPPLILCKSDGTDSDEIKRIYHTE